MLLNKDLHKAAPHFVDRRIIVSTAQLFGIDRKTNKYYSV